MESEAKGLLKLHGHVRVEHFRNGKVIAESTAGNVTCDLGVQWLAQMAMGVTTYAGYYTVQSFPNNAFFEWIAIGTGTVTPVHTDSTLTAEVMRTQWGSWSTTTTTTTDDTSAVVATFNFLSTSYAITEAGLLAHAPAIPGGTPTDWLLGHVLFGSTFNVVPGDSLVVTWFEQF